MNIVTEWNHLSWNGRVTMLWLPIRRLFVAPAPEGDRCIMGYPVLDGEAVRCPRRITSADQLWCRRHDPAVTR